MLRVIVRTSDTGAAAHVGGPVEVSVRTFDIEAADLEQFLRDGQCGKAGSEECDWECPRRR